MALRADALYIFNKKTGKYEHNEDLVDTEEPAGPARCGTCKAELEEPLAPPVQP
jgi:hypothetical protein